MAKSIIWIVTVAFILGLVVIPFVAIICNIPDKIKNLTSCLTRVAAVQGILPLLITAVEVCFSGNTRRIWFNKTVLFIVVVIFGLWLVKQV